MVKKISKKKIWLRLLVCCLLGSLLLSGCWLTSPKFFIPLGYAAIGLGIALLVTPSWLAAVSGLLLGGIIGLAVYNNSLKPDLVERLELPAVPPRATPSR